MPVLEAYPESSASGHPSHQTGFGSPLDRWRGLRYLIRTRQVTAYVGVRLLSAPGIGSLERRIQGGLSWI